MAWDEEASEVITATQVLLEEGYRSTDELLQGWALMASMAKLEQFEGECEFFRNKYRLPFEEFERTVHAGNGQENFEYEQDLEDWEFAMPAREWWRSRVEELRLAARP